VELEPIELDHELVVRPVEVDQFAGDDDVGLRLGEAGLPDQLEEAALELGLGPRGFVGELGRRGG
jgi:hypothetical protein